MIGIIWPGVAGGGGYVPSSAAPAGGFGVIWPGVAGGGGRIPSTAAPLAGFGGAGGPGPGALIGL